MLANDAAEILWEMVAMGEVRCCCAARSCFTLFCAAETSCSSACHAPAGRPFAWDGVSACCCAVLRQHVADARAACTPTPVNLMQSGAAVEDMKSKAGQLQAQLRGLISDYQVGVQAAAAVTSTCDCVRPETAGPLQLHAAVDRHPMHSHHGYPPPPLPTATILAPLVCRAATRPSLQRPLRPLTCSAAVWRSRTRRSSRSCRPRLQRWLARARPPGWRPRLRQLQRRWHRARRPMSRHSSPSIERAGFSFVGLVMTRPCSPLHHRPPSCRGGPCCPAHLCDSLCMLPPGFLYLLPSGCARVLQLCPALSHTASPWLCSYLPCLPLIAARNGPPIVAVDALPHCFAFAPVLLPCTLPSLTQAEPPSGQPLHAHTCNSRHGSQ